MANETETINSPNDDQELEDLNLEELNVGEEDDADAVKEKAQKAIEHAQKLSESNKQLFARTKKAEGFVLKDGKWIKPEPKPEVQVKAPEEKQSLTSKDTIALINAKVHEDDIDDVIEYAQFKKIPVAEALKSSVIRASLAEKEEHRQTAQATNTGKTRSGSSKVSGDQLLENARKTGELPETDEGLRELVAARLKPRSK